MTDELRDKACRVDCLTRWRLKHLEDIRYLADRDRYRDRAVETVGDAAGDS